MSNKSVIESAEIGKSSSSLTSIRWKARLLAFGAAIMAALLVWVVAHVGFGLDVRSPTVNKQHFEIGPLLVILAAVVASFLGWATLAIIERITTRARAAWKVVALLGLLISLGAPLSGTGVTTGDRVTLVFMHLTAGAVLILGLARTVRSQS